MNSLCGTTFRASTGDGSSPSAAWVSASGAPARERRRGSIACLFVAPARTRRSIHHRNVLRRFAAACRSRRRRRHMERCNPFWGDCARGSLMPTGPKGEKRPADVIGNAVKVDPTRSGRRHHTAQLKCPASDEFCTNENCTQSVCRAETQALADGARKKAAKMALDATATERAIVDEMTIEPRQRTSLGRVSIALPLKIILDVA
jgi:hypothetical protein